jgi:biopolymer transport protein ExbB/TolQ
MGKWVFPLAVLFVVVIILSIKKSIDLRSARDAGGSRLQKGPHAILFWGSISALIGFLGQASGLRNGFIAISRAQEISPRIVAQGFAESLTTTIFGLVVLIISAIVWFVLQGKYRTAGSSH